MKPKPTVVPPTKHNARVRPSSRKKMAPARAAREIKSDKQSRLAEEAVALQAARFDHEAEKAFGLIAYLEHRAYSLNAPWSEDDALQIICPLFALGMRNFFGVQVDDEGNPIRDCKHPGILREYQQTQDPVKFSARSILRRLCEYCR